MSEPTTPLLASGGLTVFGVVTGLHPMLLVAGFVGCWWYNSYLPRLTIGQRIASGLLAALVASWATPPVVLYLASLALWPATLPPMTAGFAVALAIGFMTHKVIGPAMLKIAQKKVEDIA